MNESPLSCWGRDECVFICSTESHVNQGSKGSPGDGKKPSCHQTADATKNRSTWGAQEEGSSVLAEVPLPLYEICWGRGLKESESTLAGSKKSTQMELTNGGLAQPPSFPASHKPCEQAYICSHLRTCSLIWRKIVIYYPRGDSLPPTQFLFLTFPSPVGSSSATAKVGQWSLAVEQFLTQQTSNAKSNWESKGSGFQQQMMYKIGMEGNVLDHCSIKESLKFHHNNDKAGRVLRNHLFHFSPSLGNCFLSMISK